MRTIMVMLVAVSSVFAIPNIQWKDFSTVTDMNGGTRTWLYLRDVIHMNSDTFIATGTHGILLTPNGGKDWYQKVANSRPTHIACNGKQFITIGDRMRRYDMNFVEFNTTTQDRNPYSDSVSGYDIQFINGMWIVNGSTVWTSVDGILWKRSRVCSQPQNYMPRTCESLTYGNGKYITTSLIDSYYMSGSSIDGSIFCWDSTLPAGGFTRWLNNRFVCIGSSIVSSGSSVLESANGSDWDSLSSGQPTLIREIIYVDRLGCYLFVGQARSASENSWGFSSDLKSWSGTNTYNGSKYWGVACSDNYIVAVGDQYTATDGRFRNCVRYAYIGPPPTPTKSPTFTRVSLKPTHSSVGYSISGRRLSRPVGGVWVRADGVRMVRSVR